MKLNRKEHLGKSGIYCIRNKINSKVYIGKAICIYRRIKHHITLLNTKSKDENRHLIFSWHKHGGENFEYFVLEYTSIDKLKERELYWQTIYDCTNHNKGYNMRIDTDSISIVPQETRNKCRESQIKRFQDPAERMKSSHTYWKDHPIETKKMGERISEIKTKYFFDQYTKDSVFIKRWNSLQEIMRNNPTFKRNAIYSVCSGEKPSIYGFIWKKVLKN